MDDRQVAVENAEAILSGAVRSLAFGLVDEVPVDFDPLGDDEADRFVTNRYTGEVFVGESKQYESALEVTIDDDAAEEFRRRAKSTEVLHRIAAVGVILSGGVMVLLGTGGVLTLFSRRWRRKESLAV